MEDRTCIKTKDLVSHLTKGLHDQYDEFISDYIQEENMAFATEQTDIAEKVFDLGLEPDEEINLMNECMEHIQSVMVLRQARNLGYVDAKEYESRKISDMRVEDVYKRFRNMSAYQFAQWKLGLPAAFSAKSDIGAEFKIKETLVEDAIDRIRACPPDSMLGDTLPSEYEPQDSEDEAWEQMKAFQKDNFGEFNANDLPDSFKGDY